ncbi:MAG: hypothetical protein Q7S40_24655, partial [Opitutaceae bacterium]|nr:hypothetical protein [Opitutaceae bacterium]
MKSLDQKLAEIRANPASRAFVIADAKDADMAFGVSAPGTTTAPPAGATRASSGGSPERYEGEVRFKT